MTNIGEPVSKNAIIKQQSKILAILYWFNNQPTRQTQAIGRACSEINKLNKLKQKTDLTQQSTDATNSKQKGGRQKDSCKKHSN